MIAPPVRAGVALALIGLSSLAVARTGLSDSSTAPPRAAESPSPKPQGPIASSVDPAVEKWFAERTDPCARAAAEGVPCFPLTVSREGERYSVAEEFLGVHIEPVPTPTPMPVPGMAPQAPVANILTLDPICTGKKLLKGLRGKNDTYYLYRIWDDQSGWRVEMRDRPFDPKPFAAVRGFTFVSLGKFKGECEAIAAYRKEIRAKAPPPPVPTPSPDAAGQP